MSTFYKFSRAVLLILLFHAGGYAQLSITSPGTDFTITFDAPVPGVAADSINGSGFASSPTGRQLDSDAWAATGWGDGNMNFGETKTSGDFARGLTANPVLTGGFYGFRVSPGNIIFGIQPGGSDWAPGTLTLRMQNNTGQVLVGLTVSYTIYVRNDQARGNSFNFSHSSDHITYTPVPALDYTSPAAATGTSWITEPRSATLTGLNIAPGAYYYIRWNGADVGGSGSRDEFGLNDIVVNAEGSSAVIDPSDFNALTISETQIDLSWLLNPGGNNVMIAANTTLSFGTPSGAYSVNDPIGSANVIYNGPLTFFSHQNINPGIQYYYKIWSVNASNNYSIGVVDSAYTQFLEPTGHPSALAAVTNGPTAITVSWTDSDASKYLVKGSTAGYEAITTPVDGVAEPDAALVRNVNSGVQQWQFNNLEPATPYYFKIFPYNGIGTAINYKINETIPQAMATTDPFTLALLISEVADPADSANAKFVEIYNASAAAIDFSTTPVFFNRQSNGGTVGNFALTGILSAGGKRVYAYVNTPLDPDTAKFLNAYGIEADYYNSGVSGNGNDGYFLSYGAPVTAGGYLFESFGQLNINGTGEPWEYTDKKAVRKQNVVIPNKIWTASEWHIPADTVGSKRMTPGNHGGAVTWVGGAGNSWQQRGSNWSSLNGFVPDASNTVIVPDVANDPVLGLPSAVHQLELQSGAVLIIQNTGSLQILGP